MSRKVLRRLPLNGATAPWDVSQVKEYNKHYLDSVAREFRALAPLPLGFVTQLLRVMRSLFPFRLHEEPDASQRHTFTAWIQAFPTDAVRKRVVETVRKGQPLINIHDEVLCAVVDGLEDCETVRLQTEVMAKVRIHQPASSHSVFHMSLTALRRKTGGAPSSQQLTTQEALDFCWEQYHPPNTPYIRMALLECTGCACMEAVRSTSGHTALLVEDYKALRSKTGLWVNHFVEYRALTDVLGGRLRPSCAAMSESDLIALLEKCALRPGLVPLRLHTVLTHELCVCDRAELAAALKWRLHPRFSRVNVYQWLSRQSEWYEEALDRIFRALMEHHNRTTYAEAHRAHWKSLIGRHIMFLRDYVCSTRPGEADPLGWFLANCSYSLAEEILRAFAASLTPENSRVKNSHESVHHAQTRIICTR